jgi:peroxiredoxin
MFRYFFILSLLLLVNFSSANAGDVIVRGNNPDYAGLTLVFNRFENQVSNKEQTLCATKVQPNGDFELRFNTEQTEYIFCHAGVFLFYLYVEPGKAYTIKLPQRIDKQPEDILNPFFEELKLHLVLLSYSDIGQTECGEVTNELNFFIRTFDDYYDPFFNKYAATVLTTNKPADMDTFLRKVESTFASVSNPYFRDYYNYRMGLLKFASWRFKSRNISDNYFLNKPVLYNNPAYMELFNRVYDKYFVYFGRTQDGKAIYEDINKFKSLARLKSILAQDKVLTNDTLKEFVILKGIHDGCYEMEFSRQALLQILDSLSTTTKIELHHKIASDIKEKVTKLMTGFAPPMFKLLDKDSVLVSLDDFKGKYVYLVFCTTQNYACIRDFEMLKKLQDKHADILKIVAISVDETLNNIRDFTAKYKQFNWTFLHYGNQPDVIKDYDIRAFPTYFLIDRDGKLVMSPAPGPAENFELRFFEYLRAKKIL